MTIEQYAVVGSPVSHSFSPAVFTWIAEKLNRGDIQYDAQKIEPEDLGNFIDQFKKNPYFIGFNVTVPYKESLLKYMDELSPQAKAIGAINVVQKKEGLLWGYNTDLDGIKATLKKHRCEVDGAHGLIWGAGGAARSVAFALSQQKIKKIVFFNRSIDRAEKLCREFSLLFPDTQFEVLSSLGKSQSSFQLIINSTPLGMWGGDSQSIEKIEEKFSLFDFSKKVYAFDVIYRPQETPFLKVAKKKGFYCINGLDFFLEQAFQTWNCWFDSLPHLNVSELIDYLKNRPLFLTGFMGSGKSTVGRILAKKINWKWIDVDREIEKEAKMSIAEIFLKEGQSSFRRREAQFIKRFSFLPHTIVSMGGGALGCPETRDRIKKTGQLVFLSARSTTLFKRLHSGRKSNVKRPILDSDFSLKKIEALLKEREKFYHSADIQIETDLLSPQQVALKIIHQWER